MFWGRSDKLGQKVSLWPYVFRLVKGCIEEAGPQVIVPGRLRFLAEEYFILIFGKFMNYPTVACFFRKVLVDDGIDLLELLKLLRIVCRSSIVLK